MENKRKNSQISHIYGFGANMPDVHIAVATPKKNHCGAKAPPTLAASVFESAAKNRAINHSSFKMGSD